MRMKPTIKQVHNNPITTTASMHGLSTNQYSVSKYTWLSAHLRTILDDNVLTLIQRNTSRIIIINSALLAQLLHDNNTDITLAKK